jgi:hypothetical protein
MERRVALLRATGCMLDAACCILRRTSHGKIQRSAVRTWSISTRERNQPGLPARASHRVATQCNLLQRSATCCNAVQPVATQCNLQRSAACCNAVQPVARPVSRQVSIILQPITRAAEARSSAWYYGVLPCWGYPGEPILAGCTDGRRCRRRRCHGRCAQPSGRRRTGTCSG